MTHNPNLPLEDYILERLAVVKNKAGDLELHGWYDGVECVLDGKPFMLDAGITGCEPLDTDLALWWPMSVDVVLNGVHEHLDSYTADPRAVNATRRFKAALAAGTAYEGMDVEKGDD